MMQHWIDSHCHLHYEPLASTIDETLKACTEADIAYLLSVSTDIPDFDKIAKFIHHDMIFQSVGIHPLNAKKYTANDIEDYLKTHIRREKVRAIGETGLDNYRDPLDNMQIESFRIHLKYAEESGLPIIMHLRGDVEVEKLAMELISQSKASGVAHCFGQSWEIAEFLIARDWFISFAGNVTYKNAKHLQEIAAKVPITHILIETDAPYLAPEGFRGRPNSPALVTEVGKKVSEIKNIPTESFRSHVYSNFLRFLR